MATLVIALPASAPAGEPSPESPFRPIQPARIPLPFIVLIKGQSASKEVISFYFHVTINPALTMPITQALRVRDRLNEEAATKKGDVVWLVHACVHACKDGRLEAGSGRSWRVLRNE